MATEEKDNVRVVATQLTIYRKRDRKRWTPEGEEYTEVVEEPVAEAYLHADSTWTMTTTSQDVPRVSVPNIPSQTEVGRRARALVEHLEGLESQSDALLRALKGGS